MCEEGVLSPTAWSESLLLRRCGTNRGVSAQPCGVGESALESIELSFGDCFHRYVLEAEFASYFWDGHCVRK